MKRGPDSTVIPRQPLLWLAVAFLFLVPTMIGTLPLWVPAIFLLTLLTKFAMEKRDLRLRSTALKIVLAIAALGAVIAHFGSPRGVEPGAALVVMLASLKILESHTARDFHVLVMIGWLLCLAAFLMSQALLVALCLLVTFALLLTALVQFHRRRATGGMWSPLGTAGKLLLQSLPLVVLLFLFFPRGTGGLLLTAPGKSGSAVGFSGNLAPGTVAAMANSEESAFRAEFPDGNMPRAPELYWRGAVLEDCGGLDWRTGEGLGKPTAVDTATGPTIRQRITLEPHSERWLFALDRPITAPDGARLTPARYLRSLTPVTNLRRYEVVSAAHASETELRPREWSVFLKVPALSPEVRQLALDFTKPSKDPRAIVQTALEYFRTQGFVYTLSPGEYGGDRSAALNDFLFTRKRGFCEHYAGTFATLMRAAGVPARVVVGYLGGQFNRYGNYVLVRQSDAHAWCEVWLPGTGWQRVDPTSVVAPERISLGSLREMRAAMAQGSQRRSGQQKSGDHFWQGTIESAQQVWDNVSFAWDTRVMTFDLDTQTALRFRLHLGALRGLTYCLALAAVLAAVLGAYVLWIKFRARPRTDALRTLYGKFCRKAERLGAPRTPTEGPTDYARRAAKLIPQHADRIERITDTYIALRYSARPRADLLRKLTTEVRVFNAASQRGPL